MKRISLLAIALLSVAIYSSCSKTANNTNPSNGCPDGYGGTSCLMPWSGNVIGTWTDASIANSMFAITSNNSNPKALQIGSNKTQQIGVSPFCDGTEVDYPVMANMKDESSFDIVPGNLSDGYLTYYPSASGANAPDYNVGTRTEIISGNGTLSTSGFSVTGSMVQKMHYYHTRPSYGVDGPDDSTKTVTVNFTWNRK